MPPGRQHALAQDEIDVLTLADAEAHGVDQPAGDHMGMASPDSFAQAYPVPASGQQLETGVRLALEAVEERPATTPPDVTTRPSRRRPALPSAGRVARPPSSPRLVAAVCIATGALTRQAALAGRSGQLGCPGA